MATVYGQYTFPDPQPLWSESITPVYYSGLIDHNKLQISLNGALTGNNINDIYRQKVEMISGLSTGYSTLTLDNTGYSFANPVSIDFGNSSQSRYLPYVINFDAYENKSFSSFYGITNPVNTWEFKETDGRIVDATHNVSAQGIKVNSTNPLTNAKNFVNALVSDGYSSGISFFWPGYSGFLISKDESVNRLNNLYSVTENYKFSTSREPINETGIIQLTTQVTYDTENGINARVNGDIIGGMTGAYHSPVHTGLFSPNDAYNAAVNAIGRNKSQFESGLYSNIAKLPSSFNYDVNTEANKIGFNFEFLDATKQRSGDVLNLYTVSVQSSKDDGLVSATINGEFKYQNVFDFFAGTGVPETGIRWKKVNSGFNAFNPYAATYEYYKKFVDLNVYEESGIYFLLKDPSAYNIEKKPYESSIAYSYTYDNRIDITSGQLTNASFSINYNQPIDKTGIVETILGFAAQKTHSRTIGTKSVSASADNLTGTNNANINLLKDYASGLIQPIYAIEQEDYTASQSSISVNIKGIY